MLGWGLLPNHAPKPCTGKKTGGKRSPKTQAHAPRAGLGPAPEGSPQRRIPRPGERGAEARRALCREAVALPLPKGVPEASCVVSSLDRGLARGDPRGVGGDGWVRGPPELGVRGVRTAESAAPALLPLRARMGTPHAGSLCPRHGPSSAGSYGQGPPEPCILPQRPMSHRSSHPKNPRPNRTGPSP